MKWTLVRSSFWHPCNIHIKLDTIRKNDIMIKNSDFQIKMFHTVGHFHVLCIILPICTDQGGSRCSWCHPHAAASGKCSLSAAFSRVGFIWDNFLFKTPLIKLACDQCTDHGKCFDVWHSVLLYQLSCVYLVSSFDLIDFILTSTVVGLKKIVIFFASRCHCSQAWLQ